MKNIYKIYIGGALTRTEGSIKRTYESIMDVCREYCNDVYVPHLMGTDPVKDPDVTPQEVWEIDHRQVASADLVIAYVGEPSLGTGGELEIARVTMSDIILWSFKGEKVSRMALGNPAVKHHVIADDESDLFTKLLEILKTYEYNTRGTIINKEIVNQNL